MNRDEMAELLDEKLGAALDEKLDEKLQPLCQATNGLSARMAALETKVDDVAKDVRQIKYDTSKLRGRMNRVDLEELRTDVDAIKATLGLE